MKKLVLAAAIAATFASGAVQAEEIAPGVDLSFNVAVTTDYIFRGIEQADEGLAIQGGADLAFSNGVYVGTWLSSLKATEGNNVETDVYLGYAGEYEGVSYDVGVIDYIYQDDSTFNTWEAYVSVGYGPVSVKYSHSLTESFAAADEGTGYIEANADFEVGAGVGIGLHVGRTMLKEFDGDDKYDDITDYGITLSKSVAGVDFSLAVTDTNIDGDDAKVAFAISKSF